MIMNAKFGFVNILYKNLGTNAGCNLCLEIYYIVTHTIDIKVVSHLDVTICLTSLNINMYQYIIWMI